MPRTRVADAATRSPSLRLPAAAERLRLPLYSRNQSRMLQRWGFDLNASDAAARAEALLAASPADAEHLVLVASVRASRGEDSAALRAAEAAVAADERSARAHTTLATVLAHAGDRQGSGRHAVRAAELDPADPTVVYNRGVAAWALGDRKAARADFERVGELLGLGALPWWTRWRRGR